MALSRDLSDHRERSPLTDASASSLLHTHLASGRTPTDRHDLAARTLGTDSLSMILYAVQKWHMTWAQSTYRP